MAAGATLDLPARYRDPRHLANGGMAAVYAAQDSVLGRQVAIKVLAAHVAEDADAVRRFQREARAAARVSQHPHVVTIYDVGEHGDRPFIVMALMEGGSLAGVLREGRPARGDALRWVAETASALDAAHEHGIVHRDVKPGNLLLDARGRLGVADFGIARLAYESAVTQTGQVLGTAAYLSPEQAAGDQATEASDRYSLAVVAYELLTGARPYRGGNLAAQARQHVEDDPVPASRQSAGLPAAVDGVLVRGLAKDPAARWASATDFAQALAAAASEDATAATRPLRGAGAAPAPTAPAAAADGPVTPKTPLARRETADVPPAPVAPARSRRRLLPFALVGVLLVLAGAIALASGGGGDEAQRASDPASPARERTTAPPREEPPSAATPSPSGEPASGAGAAELNDRGFSLMNQGRYGEAIPLLEQAVERCGDSRETVCAYALYNLGRSLRLAGRPAEAIPILERRLTYDNQTAIVQAELDAARAAASGETSPAPGADHSREENRGKGSGNRGKGKRGDD